MMKATEKYQNEKYVFNLLCPETDADGNLLLQCEFKIAEIAMEAAQEIGYFIMCGLRLGVDAYLPMYAPDEVLVIANEERVDDKDKKHAILIQEMQFVLARRAVEGGRIGFRLFRDDSFYENDENIDVFGYVVGTIHDSEIEVF